MSFDDDEYTTAKRNGSGTPASQEWIPDEALANLNLEKDVRSSDPTDPINSPEELAKSVFREGAPMAAMSIVHMATNEPNANTRLRAAQYVTERALGSLTNPVATDKGNPWDEILGDIVKDTTEEELIQQARATLSSNSKGEDL